MRTIYILLALAGCTSPVPDRFVVLDHIDDGVHALVERELPGLHDPRHLDGTYTRGFTGGRYGDVGFPGRRPIELSYVVQDGVGVPLDFPALALWSAYGHLADLDADLEAWGYDVAGMFPVDVTHAPAFAGDQLEINNMAYSCSDHSFITYDASFPTGAVDYTANEGIVRHEAGHALEAWLLGGEAGCGYKCAASEGGRAWSEAWADIVTTLTLDAPEVFSASFEGVDRDVRGDWVATPAVIEVALGGSNPYPLGTVAASFVWDVRRATDPQTAFDLAWAALLLQSGRDCDALPGTVVDAYVLDYVALAQSVPAAHAAACESLGWRFPDLKASSCAR